MGGLGQLQAVLLGELIEGCGVPVLQLVDILGLLGVEVHYPLLFDEDVLELGSEDLHFISFEVQLLLRLVQHLLLT